MQFRHVAVPHRSPQNWQRESVDLQEDDPRHIGLHLFALSARNAPDHPQHVGVVVVGAEDHLEDDARRSDDERGQQRPTERIDLDRIRVDLRREQKDHGIQDQHRDEADRERERQPQGRHERRQHGVEHGDQRGRDERIAERLDRHVRHDRGRDKHRHRRHHPVQDQAQRPKSRRLRSPAHGLAITGIGPCRHGAEYRSRVAAVVI